MLVQFKKQVNIYFGKGFMGITKIVNVFLENVSHALKKLTTCISNNGQNVQCALQSYCVKCFNTFVDFFAGIQFYFYYCHTILQ